MKLLPFGRKNFFYLVTIYGSVVRVVLNLLVLESNFFNYVKVRYENARKSTLHLIFRLQLGAGSYLFHHFSVMVNSVLVNFGISEEMHNLVRIGPLVYFNFSNCLYWLYSRKYFGSWWFQFQNGVYFPLIF